MSADRLKVIAEGMGYGVAIKARNIKGVVREAVFNFDGGDRYDPLEKNDQMVEIMGELKLNIEWVGMDNVWECWRRDNQITAHYKGGKTINEAVCNAAYEYFKKHD